MFYVCELKESYQYAINVQQNIQYDLETVDCDLIVNFLQLAIYRSVLPRSEVLL